MIDYINNINLKKLRKTKEINFKIEKLLESYRIPDIIFVEFYQNIMKKKEGKSKRK